MGAAIASGSGPRATASVTPSAADADALGGRVLDGPPASGIEPHLGDALGGQAARGDA